MMGAVRHVRHLGQKTTGVQNCGRVVAFFDSFLQLASLRQSPCLWCSAPSYIAKPAIISMLRKKFKHISTSARSDCTGESAERTVRSALGQSLAYAHCFCSISLHHIIIDGQRL